MGDVPPAALTEAQRQQFTRYPALDEQGLARHYLLVEADLRLVRQRRREVNRLGYAVQLTVLKHLGRGLRQGEAPPPQIITYLADQLRVDPLFYELGDPSARSCPDEWGEADAPQGLGRRQEGGERSGAAPQPEFLLNCGSPAWDGKNISTQHLEQIS